MNVRRVSTICAAILAIQIGFTWEGAADYPRQELQISICADDSVHVILGFRHIMQPNGTKEWLDVSHDDYPNQLQTGSDGYLYGVFGSNHSKKKMDCTGHEIGPASTKMLQGNQVVVDGNGKHVLFDRNGTVDSGNNLHMFESTSEGLAHTRVPADGLTPSNRSIIAEWLAFPWVDIDAQDYIHVIGQTAEENLAYLQLDTNGTVQRGPLNLTSDLLSNLYLGWDIRVDHQGNVHIVFAQPVPSMAELWYMKLDADGSVIVDGTRLIQAHYTPDDLYSEHPNIAIDSSNNVHIVWVGVRTADYNHIDRWGRYYMKLDSTGNILSGPINLNGDDSFSQLMMLMLALIAVAIVVAVLFLLWRRRKGKRTSRTDNITEGAKEGSRRKNAG